MKYSPLFAICLFGTGCVAVDFETEVATHTQEIVGGVPTEGDPAIVALLAKEPGAEQGALCTGTIIAPDVVLTAAHCVFPSLVGENAEFTVALGHDLTSDGTAGPEIPVAEVHFDPQFNPGLLFNGHDIAVAILSTPVDITPIPYRRTPLTSGMSGDSVRIVGYGLNNGFAQTGAGIKRTADVRLNSFNNNFVRTGQFGKNICNGDSGGPVLMEIDGQETVIGVNSFGFIFCLFESSSTRVDTYAGFVDQFIN